MQSVSVSISHTLREITVTPAQPKTELSKVSEFLTHNFHVHIFVLDCYTSTDHFVLLKHYANFVI